MIPGALLRALESAHRILCVSHVAPDGDAVGSLTGMGWILHGLGKERTLALQDAVPESYQWLPSAEQIVDEHVVADAYDAIICLDASSPDRMGRIYREDAHAGIPLLVIDHHITNTEFGDVNWVAPDCAATCQMLVYLANELNIPLAGPLAECLLTGLVTDTHCFRTSNTDAGVLAAAVQLVDAGADLSRINERTLNRRPYSVLRLWGSVLPTVQLEERVIWSCITQQQIAEAGQPEDDGQLSSMLVTVNEADISAVFTEKLDDAGQSVVECSFRAKPGYDVSEVALALGGGGHPAASGCTVPGTLGSVTPRVVDLLQQARQKPSVSTAP